MIHNYGKKVLGFQDSISVLNPQYKFEIAIGVGFPEIINLKIKYGWRNVQIAFGGGVFPVDNIRTVDVGLYYHILGKSKFAEQFPWYTLGGLNFTNYNYEFGIARYLSPYLRIGRAINFSKKFGLSIDIGPGLVTDVTEDDVGGRSEPFIIPSESISLFIRFPSPF
jgi:hypothetical protein